MDNLKSNANVDSTFLRRSSRVVKPRSEIEIIFGAERPYKKRVKSKSKKSIDKNKNSKGKANGKTKSNHDKEINNKLTKEKNDKGLNTYKRSVTSDKKKKKKSLAKTKAIAKNKVKKAELSESALTKLTWSTYSPLLSQDFKNQSSVISRLKSPNTKSIPYAGLIIKIMSFINKFYNYFGSDLLCLSFQDFEIGLNLYPNDLGSSSLNKDGIFNEQKQQFELYQDFIPIIDVKRSQDKMNLLFYSLLKILFSTTDDNFDEPAELNALEQYPKKQLKNWLDKLRRFALEWGYPKEWRLLSSNDRTTFEKPIFEKDDSIPIDSKVKEILTPNVYQWPEVLELDKADHPLMDPELENTGLHSMHEPMDRLILLKTIVDWCISNSTLIHDYIYRLSHMKGEPSFGVQSQQVPRFYIEGPERTMKNHIKSCLKFLDKMDTRFKNKHYKKLLKDDTQPELRKKQKALHELKELLSKASSEEEKEELILSMGAKWEVLFKDEVYDNALNNPYQNPIYQLRAQEFFIGRVPFIGDFYIPRLHSYGNESTMNTFTDLRSLTKLLDNFKEGAFDSYTLFDNYGQNMSSKFKVLYHDTPSLMRDMAKNINFDKKNYWFEMCHDTTSLKDFLELLDYKITPPPKKEKNAEPAEASEVSEINTASNNSHTSESNDTSVIDESIVAESENEKKQQKDKKTPMYDTSINKHSLPKDSKYNSSRERLQIMRDYLDKMYYMFKAYEELKEKFGNMQPGKRQLRSTRRQNYVDEYVASDNEDYLVNNGYNEDEHAEDEEEDDDDDDDDEEGEEEDDDEEDDAMEDYNGNDDLEERSRARSTRSSSRATKRARLH